MERYYAFVTVRGGPQVAATVALFAQDEAIVAQDLRGAAPPRCFFAKKQGGSPCADGYVAGGGRSPSSGIGAFGAGGGGGGGGRGGAGARPPRARAVVPHVSPMRHAAAPIALPPWGAVMAQQQHYEYMQQQAYHHQQQQQLMQMWVMQQAPVGVGPHQWAPGGGPLLPWAPAAPVPGFGPPHPFPVYGPPPPLQQATAPPQLVAKPSSEALELACVMDQLPPEARVALYAEFIRQAQAAVVSRRG